MCSDLLLPAGFRVVRTDRGWSLFHNGGEPATFEIQDWGCESRKAYAAAVIHAWNESGRDRAVDLLIKGIEKAADIDDHATVAALTRAVEFLTQQPRRES